MLPSILSICLAITIVVVSAQVQPQCKASAFIKGMDGIANYSISGLQQNQTFYYTFNDGSSTTVSLSVCSPNNCFSQCAVQTTNHENGAHTCYGICGKSATIMGQGNYNGLNLNYTTAGGNSAQVTLSCNPQLDPTKVTIQQVTLNGSVLSVVGEAYCSSTPQPWTMTQIFFGQGARCDNWDIYDNKYSLVSTCKGGCTGDSAGSILTSCYKNF